MLYICKFSIKLDLNQAIRVSHTMLNVFMLSVIVLGVIMLSVIILSVVILSVVILSVVILSVVILSVAMLIVAMLSVVRLNDAAPRHRSARVCANIDAEYFIFGRVSVREGRQLTFGPCCASSWSTLCSIGCY